jgi:hypothetical protein
MDPALAGRSPVIPCPAGTPTTPCRDNSDAISSPLVRREKSVAGVSTGHDDEVGKVTGDDRGLAVG